MPVTAKWFGKALMKGLNAEVNWTNDTIKVALYNAAIPGTAQDGWAYKSDITGLTEVSGTGYTAGGATLGTKTITYTDATNVIMLDAADTSWANSTITAMSAIIYKDTGTASTSVLLGYVDFGGSFSSSSGTFQITWDAAGIFTITAA